MRKETGRLLIMTEEWRDIAGYEGKYMVSNTGKVKSLERTVWTGKGYYQTLPERILKADKEGGGYYQVTLFKDGKRSRYKVHRLVAQAFIPNPDNLPCINHKDENKKNNCVQNLEWCTYKYNSNYGTNIERSVSKRRKAVIGTNIATGNILEFPSAPEAERQLGIAGCSICRCCNGKAKSAGGYVWHYVNSEEVCNE